MLRYCVKVVLLLIRITYSRFLAGTPIRFHMV
jgi:hypothetical protein